MRPASFQDNFNKETSTETISCINKENTLSTVDSHTMDDQGIDMTLVRKYFFAINLLLVLLLFNFVVFILYCK